MTANRDQNILIKIKHLKKRFFQLLLLDSQQPRDLNVDQYLNALILQWALFWTLQRKGFFDGNKDYFLVAFRTYKKLGFSSFHHYFSSFVQFITNHSTLKFKEANKNVYGQILINPDILYVDSTVLNQIHVPDDFYYQTSHDCMYKNTKKLTLFGFFLWLEEVQISINGNFISNLYEMLLKMDEKKERGIFFTPEAIVRTIVSQTIHDYLYDSIKNAVLNSNGSKSIENLLETADKKKKLVIASYLLNSLTHLTILDPAVGSGHFLAVAVRELVTWHTKLQAILSPFLKKNSRLLNTDNDPLLRHVLKIYLLPEKKRSLYLMRDIIYPYNIYGVDIEPNAVKITKIRFFLDLLEEKLRSQVDCRLSNFTTNLKVGNTLFGATTTNIDVNDLSHPKLALVQKKLDLEFFSLIPQQLDPETLKLFHWNLVFPEIFSKKKPGFDVIVGNPPYGRRVLTVVEKTLAKKIYQSIQAQNAKKRTYNVSALFIERSIQLAKPGGIIGLIVPNSIARVEEYETLRQLMLKECQLYRIIDNGAPFPGVTLEMITIFMKKRLYTIKKKNSSVVEQVCVISRRNTFQKKPLHIDIPIFKRFRRFILYADTFFHVITEDCTFNVISGDYGLDHRRVEKDLTKKPDTTHTVPFLHSGRSVKRYYLDTAFIHWSKPYEHGRFKKLFDETSIISTAITSYPKATLKPPGIIPGTNVSILNITTPDLHPKTALLILNSTLIRDFVFKYILNYSNLTIYLHKYYTHMIPIKIPQDQTLWKILADYLLFLNLIRELSKNGVISKHTIPQKNVSTLISFYDTTVADALVIDLYLSNYGKNTDNSPAKISEHLKKHLKPLPYPFTKYIHPLRANLIPKSHIKKNYNIINETTRVLTETPNFITYCQKLKEFYSKLMNSS